MPEATPVERALAGAASELTAAGKRFALVGGFAVSVRAEPRFTRDVDFAVAVANDREAEALVYERATLVAMPGVVELLVVRAEELLAMKVLSMTEDRLQDRIDAKNLLLFNPDMDLGRVRELLRLIAERGFHREQDLEAKLEGLL